MAIRPQILEKWRARVLQWIEEWHAPSKRCQSLKQTNGCHLSPSIRPHIKSIKRSPNLLHCLFQSQSRPHFQLDIIFSLLRSLRPSQLLVKQHHQSYKGWLRTQPYRTWYVLLSQSSVGTNARQMEGEKMWDIFQAYATREQNLESTRDGLIEQLNR